MGSVERAGIVRPSGNVGLTVLKGGLMELSKEQVAHYGSPREGLRPEVNEWRSRNWDRVRKQYRRIALAKRLGIPTMYGELRLRVLKASGDEYDLGLASLRVVTDTGVGFIVDAFQNIVELEIMKFHGFGSGTTGETAAQAALITEYTTELNPNSTRATGTLAEAAANIYQTVGVIAFDATVANTEHGLFSQAATGGGVMFDRSVYAAVNLVSGDGLSADYRATFVSGG